MTSYANNRNFATDVFGNRGLDDALEWIRTNLDIEDVFTEGEICQAAEERFGYRSPGYVEELLDEIDELRLKI